MIMDKLFGWTKSTLGIAVVILTLGATVGLFTNLVSSRDVFQRRHVSFGSILR